MTNVVLNAIATRDSCRAYTKEAVSQEDIEAIALAGVQAPSSRGTAPWKIVVVTDPDLIKDISDSALRLMVRHDPEGVDEFAHQTIFFDAPVVFILAARRTWDYSSEDLDIGLATENIALAATGLGLGSLICGDATQAFRDLKSDDADRLYRRLAIPREYEMTISVAVGHRAESSTTPHTPDLSAVTYI